MTKTQAKTLLAAERKAVKLKPLSKEEVADIVLYAKDMQARSVHATFRYEHRGVCTPSESERRSTEAIQLRRKAAFTKFVALQAQSQLRSIWKAKPARAR